MQRTTRDTDEGRPGIAFSEAAATYDDGAALNPMMRWLQRESLRELEKRFRPGDRLLEVGCGSGAEAIALARLGCKVLATDASEGMVETVRLKLARGGAPPGSLEAVVLPVEQLKALVDKLGSQKFDGAYSSLGPLNCTPYLEQVANHLADLVKPGGYLVISLLTKYCLWESAWYAAHLRPRLALRRWRGHSSGTAMPHGTRLEVYYWSVAHVERVFGGHFRRVGRRALPWLLPPTYAAGFLGRHPRLFALLDRLERVTALHWPFYKIGDHVHLVFVRRDR